MQRDKPWKGEMITGFSRGVHTDLSLPYRAERNGVARDLGLRRCAPPPQAVTSRAFSPNFLSLPSTAPCKPQLNTCLNLSPTSSSTRLPKDLRENDRPVDERYAWIEIVPPLQLGRGPPPKLCQFAIQRFVRRGA